MKPPEEFIKYLQAHPAVWGALQEGHEWSDGEWGYDTDNDELYLMSQDTGTLVVLGGMAGVVKWIPHLGQLVRTTAQLGAEPVLQSRAGVLAVILAWMCFDDAWSGPERTSEWEEEPEIACLALWAKVKGIESD